jgi:hypothetical protein
MINTSKRLYNSPPGKKVIYDRLAIFGELLRDTDKWVELPFKNNEDHLIDFVQEFQECNNIRALTDYSPQTHLKNNFSGFANMNGASVLISKQHTQFFPKFVYLQNGAFRYLQLEGFDAESSTYYKDALFLKNNFSLSLFAFTPKEESAESYKLIRPKITEQRRSMIRPLREGYLSAEVVQLEDKINISLYPQSFLELKGIVSARESPLMKLEYSTKRYTFLLEQLSEGEDLFKNLDTIKKNFGGKLLSETSLLYQLDNAHPKNTGKFISLSEGINIIKDNMFRINNLYKTV